MKKYIFFLFLLFPGMIHSQTTVTMLPDSVWEDPKTADWYVNGTTFYNYNGAVYTAVMKEVQVVLGSAITQQSLYPYFYLFNKDNKNESLSQLKFGSPLQNFINYYGYPKENESGGMLPQITGKTFFFQYNGTLWYFQHILTGVTVNSGKDRKNESYECFAEMNLNAQGKLNKVYYDLRDPVPDVIKQGAFQLDSLLFFVGINKNSSSANYNKWCVQKYLYDGSTGKFTKSADPDIYFPNLRNTTAFGGMFARLDSLQNVLIMLDTYAGGTSTNNIGLITPAKTTSGYTFSYRTLDSLTYSSYPVGSAVLLEGALKGQKSSEPSPTLADRFAYVMTNSSKASDGKYHMYYREFYIYPDNHIKIMNQGELKVGNYPVPVTYYVNGDKKTAFDMTGGYELIPKDYSNQLSGIDGYQERIDVFYPDGSADMNCAELLSDQFRLNDLTTVVSADLDDTLSYPGIKGLWSLNGIVDGAPPCAMDWEAWDSTLNLNQHEDAPTEMEFVTSQDSTVTSIGTYEDRWSVGASLDFDKELKGKSKKLLSLSGDLKYFGAYENEIQNKTTWRKETVTSFSLHEYNQEQGWFIWTVPEMTRYKYDVYPWWETKNNYPIPNTTNYLFRTTGIATVLEAIDLDKDPFYIINPNDPGMQSWKQGGSRDSLVDYSLQYNHPPIDNISWTNGQNGTTMHYAILSGTSSKYSFTNGFKEKITATVKIPEVFKFSVYESNEFSYSTSVECETEFGTEITASLHNLTSSTMGIAVTHLNMDVYWMHQDSVKNVNTGQWEQINWWFYDSLAGMKPWYIAYKVNTANATIRLVSPSEVETTEISGLLFSWHTEGEPLSDFVVYIADAPGFSSSSVVHHQSAGAEHSLSPTAFRPEAGRSYYWRVSGRTPAGETVWSPRGSFILKDPEAESGNAGDLKASIYPNPGRSGEVRIAVSSDHAETVLCSIYSASGNLMFRDHIALGGPGIVTTITVNPAFARGVYIVEIKREGERVVKKMVIM